MMGKYLNKKVLEDLQNIVEYGKDISKNDSVTLSALVVERDAVQIKNGNPEQIDKLYESLIDQLAQVGIYIACMSEKLRVLIRVFDDCQKGVGNFTSIFEAAEGENKALETRCFNNITLSKIELQRLNNAVMKMLNVQVQCIRNNAKKQKLVCSLWTELYTNQQIADRVSDINVDDAAYFASLCKPANVSPSNIESICTLKKGPEPLPYIINNYFSRYNQTQVTDAYNKCP